ncbi:6-bladed beta-propeller protein [Marinoscillum furvescens DSM 4134]|uniref:6-bladed beta-propeller protein n=2 Tax=Marinoscillum furvescens TaxID=1026 RepID=A0A3D9L1Z5_MARFU|nr:6-bladed beta-propeller protein [Marinoscillum furvescens DSM 4134]
MSNSGLYRLVKHHKAIIQEKVTLYSRGKGLGIVYVLMTLVICSCQLPAAEKPAIAGDKDVALITVDVDSLPTENTVRYSSLFEDVEFIQLETSEMSQLGKISQIEVVNDTFFILDDAYARSVLLFASNGKFLRKVGKVGRGKGEYLKPSSFTVDVQTHTVLIVDRMLSKIVRYNYRGEYIEEIVPRKCDMVLSVGVEHSNLYVHNVPNHPNQSGNALVMHIDDRGRPDQSYLTDVSVFSKLGLDSSSPFFNYQNGLRCYTEFSNYVYSLEDKRMTKYVHLKSATVPKRTILGETLKHTYDPTDPSTGFRSIPGVWGIHNYLENDEWIYFKYLSKGNDHSVFYAKSANDPIVTNRLIDDMTGGYSAGKFLSISEKGMVSYLFGRRINSSRFSVDPFFEKVNDGSIRLNKENRKILDHYTHQNNPVLMVYNFKVKDEKN